jgi:hypothetical protein
MVNEPEKIPRSRNTAFPSASFANCQLLERKVKKKFKKGEEEKMGLEGERRKRQGRMTQTLDPGNIGDK